MPRINLVVPASEQDEAKRLGARLDRQRKVWFVPECVDPLILRRWLPRPEDVADFNIRAESYVIARAETSCWKCKKVTRVYGVIVPAGFEEVEMVTDEDGNEAPFVFEYEDGAFVHGIGRTLPPVEKRLQSVSPLFRPDNSLAAEMTYWMNHCDACGEKQGDHYIYSEPGGAFFPLDDSAIARIGLQAVQEPFRAFGAISLSSVVNRLLGDEGLK